MEIKSLVDVSEPPESFYNWVRECLSPRRRYMNKEEKSRFLCSVRRYMEDQPEGSQLPDDIRPRLGRLAGF